jgi:catechol 2,3-dioxygenase-like lactoylglutathione lyase family enzyme
MQIRYLVNDLERAIEFYSATLGFSVVRKMPPLFALLKLGDSMLWLSGPGSPAAAPLPDGSVPQPGGWCRAILGASDLDALIAQLRGRSVKFRGNPYETPAGKHILIEDPSGNLIEVVQFRREQHVTH